MKKINSVRITPGCISCGTCEFIAPAIFEVTDTARVRPCVQYQKYEAEIKAAVDACPVRVIEVDDSKS